ncbi:MAG: Do family serine endopeptidase [Cyclobacteriaceae bacterium]|nr:Do family serine endopeptidase [Cyclobacteriaceae bacterium]
MNRRQLMVGLLFASLFGGIVALGGYKLFEKETPSFIQSPLNNNVQFSSYLNDSSFTVPAGLNFVYAAEIATPRVVHIKSTISPTASNNPHRSPYDDMFRDFFGDPRGYHGQQRPAQSAGSGVIISENGYIVTNNHVIADADEMEVTLYDNRTYIATLVGTDPNTDIAVIKIDEEDLPFVNFGNSDIVKVGEWVLAVGNPFDLTSTVTAGIVSAKGRNIGILRERYGIESFIQTDAAVNPGNSGGALVNLRGELIGINTAIATPTGSYAGYSFAVPVSLVEKVVDDLVEYGIVQRAVLGIEILNVNDPRIDEDLDELKGVYVAVVRPNSAAKEAGLENGDVIIEINKTEVANVAQLQDLVARHHPGDKIDVTYKRNGKTKTLSAKLKNLDNEIKIVKKNDSYVIEGASLRNASEEEIKNYDVSGGVVLGNIGNGKWKDAGIKDGFLITSINNRSVKNVNELRAVLRDSSGDGVLIKGKYPDGKEVYYGMGW